MAIIALVLDGLVDVCQWTADKVAKGVKKGAPIAKEGIKSISEWIGSHISDSRIELKPINISLVAPSGFGKTTLISTIMHEMNLRLTKTDKERSYELDIRPTNEEDNNRLLKINKVFDNAIVANCGKISTVSIEGSGEIASYNYEIAMSAPGNKKELIQPFCMMDIPGGWINPEERQGSEVENQWEKFEEHLHESKILWIPIDAVALMEVRTPKEKSASAKLLNVTDISNLAMEWAKYRTDDEESCICFVPIKCETYKLFGGDTDNADKKFREKFNAFIETIVHNVKESNDKANIKMYYTPVETIGCIKKISAKWTTDEADSDKVKFSADFAITGNARKIKGADALLCKVYEYAYNQILDMEKYDETRAGKANFFDRKKYELAFQSVKKAVKPIVDELGKHTALQEKLEEID